MIDFVKIVLRLAIAAALIWFLIRITGVDWTSFSKISWPFIGLALLFSIITLLLRAMNFKMIARYRSYAPFASWMRLSATHQILFSAIPSGLGDLSFPLLANRETDLDLGTGARLIALVRARDALTLLTLAGVGLVLEGRMHILFALIPIATLVMSLKLEVFTTALLSQLPTNGKISSLLAPIVRDATDLPPLKHRMNRVLSSVAVWLSASAAVWAAFMSAGAALAIGDVFVMIAGLNVIGLLAISVAGLGVSELGAAGILIWLGWSTDSAAASALVGRPALLICVLFASGLIWGYSSLAIGRNQATTAQLKPSR